MATQADSLPATPAAGSRCCHPVTVADALMAAGIALRATNTHGEPAAQPGRQPDSHGPAPASERADQAPPTPGHTHQETQPQ